MDSSNEVKKINITIRRCFYFDDVIEIENFNLDNILIFQQMKKSQKNVLVDNISEKTLIDAKSLRIRFYKIDCFIRVYDGTICLLLSGSEIHDFIFNRIRYLIRVNSGITYVIFHNYAKTKVDLYDSLTLEKRMTFHNVIILIK